MSQRRSYALGQGGMKLPLCPVCQQGGKVRLLTLEPLDDEVMAKGRIKCHCGHEWEGTFENPELTLDVVQEAIRDTKTFLRELDVGELGKRARAASKELAGATEEMNKAIERAERELRERFPNSLATIEIEATKNLSRTLVYDQEFFLITVRPGSINSVPLKTTSRRVRTMASDFLLPLLRKLSKHN